MELISKEELMNLLNVTRIAVELSIDKDGSEGKMLTSGALAVLEKVEEEINKLVIKLEIDMAKPEGEEDGRQE